MSRTGHAAKLFGHSDEPTVDMHPQDMTALGLAEGGLVLLDNLNGRYIGRVRGQSGQRRSELFVPMHWNGRFASASCADGLVNSITDPLCGQPEFKHSPVMVKAYPCQWRGLLVLSERLDFRPDTDYWALITLNGGHKYRVADHKPLSLWSEDFKSRFPAINDWVELLDSDQHHLRLAGFIEGELVLLFHADAGNRACRESAWVDKQLNQPCDLSTRYALLAGYPGTGIEDEGRLICSCYQVGEKAIIKGIEEGLDSAQSLGKALKCGTNCGSCIPELNQLVQKHAAEKLAVKIS